MPKPLFYSQLLLAVCVCSLHFTEAEAATRSVNSTSNNPSTIGTLPYWLLNSDDSDTIDCSAIAGQQITLTSSLPAITKNYTINGAGITIDGDNLYQAFQVASGTAVAINNVTIQNALSKGGAGGSGYSGGGGAVGGSGALYIHGGTSVTLTASSLLNNTARGGDGGAADNNGNAGAGGGGGFGGGDGGSSLTLVSTGGGGGGHSNGGSGGTSSSTNGANGVYFGGAGGGAGINSVVPGGNGGNASPNGAFVGGAESGGNGGGGAGDSQDGYSATGTGGSGVPGNGGNGIGVDFLFGAGGGGGCASETGFPGGNGTGAAGGGGGGGSNYSGGAGGILGGGGAGGLGATGGDGGFGAGGGGATTGGTGGGGAGAGGGFGGSDPSAVAGGGGGSGLGGAIFIQKAALLTIVDAPQIASNTAIAGIGGTSTNSSDPGYIAPGDGTALGQDIFMRQGSSLIFDISNTLAIPSPIEGDALTTPIDNSGSFVKKGAGKLQLNGTNSYVGSSTIEQGTLQLNGSINGDLQVNASGTLAGNATINGSISNSGTLSPGNSIGTIFATTLSLTSTSVYNVEINPSHADLIDVSGSASLAGVLRITPAAGGYSRKGRFLILKAAGGVTGSFASIVAQDSPEFKFTIEQDGNNVFLAYTLAPLPPKHLKGRQKKHLSSSRGDKRVNVVKWHRPSQSLPPVAYKIYRNNLKHLKAVVSAKKELKFKDYILKKNKHTYKYYVVSVDRHKVASSPAKVKIKHRKHVYKRQ